MATKKESKKEVEFKGLDSYGLEVTDVKVTVLAEKRGKKKSSLKGFASITLNEVMVIKGFKIVDGKKGLFVAKPSSKGSDDEYYDDVFCLTKDANDDLADAILCAYEEELGE